MANHVIRYFDEEHTKKREYSRLLRELKQKFPGFNRDSHTYYVQRSVPLLEPTPLQFIGSNNEEPVVCSHFGCPVHLSPQEKLFGSKCINHQSKEKIDPTLFVSYPNKSA